MNVIRVLLSAAFPLRAERQIVDTSLFSGVEPSGRWKRRWRQQEGRALCAVKTMKNLFLPSRVIFQVSLKSRQRNLDHLIYFAVEINRRNPRYDLV